VFTPRTAQIDTEFATVPQSNAEPLVSDPGSIRVKRDQGLTNDTRHHHIVPNTCHDARHHHIVPNTCHDTRHHHIVPNHLSHPERKREGATAGYQINGRRQTGCAAASGRCARE
jgi:hypothetical protein